MLMEFAQFGFGPTTFRVDDVSGFTVFKAQTTTIPARPAGWFRKARPERVEVVAPAKVIVFFRNRGRQDAYDFRCRYPDEDTSAEEQNALAETLATYIIARLRGLEPPAIKQEAPNA